MMTWNRPERDLHRLGNWSFELRGDEIADLRYADRRVLRSVRAVIRDDDWNTMPLVVENVDSSETGIELSVYSGGALAFSGTVRVDVDGDLDAAEFTVTMDLRSERRIQSNRTGLVVLHPPQVAGLELLVRHSDGTTEHTRYPEQISAHQPVLDITRLSWTDDGTSVDVRFDGDVFEMEDQRNWTDASFKTYSRPLSLPFPYVIDADERVVQSISVRALSTARGPSDAGDALTLVAAGTVPAVGVEASTAPDPVPVSPAGAFRVVELNLATPSWSAALDRAAGDGVPMDVRLITDGSEPALVEALVALKRYIDAPGVLRLTAFNPVEHVSDARVIAALRAGMASVDLSVSVVAGARSHFTELNREQARIQRDVEGIVVTTTPLFHTLDTEQLVEALSMQRLIAQQSVLIADGLPVHVGPVSLRPRFNNVATTPQPTPTRTDLSEGYGAELTGTVDERQASPELGAWVIASAAAFAVPGVASVSWFETWGPRGLVAESGRTAAAEAVDALVSLDGGALVSGMASDGLVWAIGSRTSTGDVVLIANVGKEARHVLIDDIGEVRIEAGEWVRAVSPDQQRRASASLSLRSRRE